MKDQPKTQGETPDIPDRGSKGAPKGGQSPPGRWLLSLVIPSNRLDCDLGDFEELFQRLRRERGPGAARLAYWKELLLSLAPYLQERAEDRRFRRQSLRDSPTKHRRGGVVMSGIWRDLVYSVRSLKRSPVVALVAVVSLALGMGANTAIFSLMNSVLLRSLPVENPHELVLVHSRRGDQRASLSYPVFREMLEHQTSFTGMLAAAGSSLVRASRRGEPIEDVRAESVSGDFFSVLGVDARIGRCFTARDDLTGGGPDGNVAVISHGFWDRHFAKDPAAIGATITVDKTTYTIVGVTPVEFFGTSISGLPDLWLPMSQSVSERSLTWRTGTFFNAMARLKPGVSESQAAAALGGLYQRLLGAEKASGERTLVREDHVIEDYHIQLESASGGFASLRRQFSRPLQVLMALVGLVLVIACCNVANLLLARGASRRREIGVRLALGSSRLRLLQQLLAEGLLLASTAGLAGLVVAYFTSRVLVAFVATGPNAALLELQPDLRILGFTASVVLLTGILFGLVPALQGVKSDVGRTLAGSSGRHSATRSKQRLGRSLVIGQFALSLLLLVASGLLLRSLQSFRSLDVGFHRENVLLVDVSFALDPNNETQRILLARRLNDRLEVMPGVESASAAWLGLFSGSDMSATLEIQEYAHPSEEELNVRLNIVSPGYFQTLDSEILAGRGFGPADRENAPGVALVNQSFVRAYSPASSPLGKWVQLKGSEGRSEIVGVVEDSKWNDLRSEPDPMFFLPLEQWGMPIRSLAFRSQSDAATLVPSIRTMLRDLKAGALVREVKTLKTQVDRSITQERMLTQLSSAFGLLGLFLACVGLYGVMSYRVIRRRSEIGIRLAMGARRSQVSWLVLRDTLMLAGIGIAIGLPVALAGTRLLEKFLFGLSPNDPATIAATICILVLVALGAGYPPARRASRIEPIEALRYE